MRLFLLPQMQALATAMLTADPTSSIDASDLYNHPESKNIGANYHHAVSALQVMHRLGMIHRFIKAYGKNKYSYELLPEKKKAAIAAIESRRNVKLDKEVSKELPNDIVTYVTGTATTQTNNLEGIDITVNKTDNSLQITYKGLQVTLRVA